MGTAAKDFDRMRAGKSRSDSARLLTRGDHGPSRAQLGFQATEARFAQENPSLNGGVLEGYHVQSGGCPRELEHESGGLVGLGRDLAEIDATGLRGLAEPGQDLVGPIAPLSRLHEPCRPEGHGLEDAPAPLPVCFRSLALGDVGQREPVAAEVAPFDDTQRAAAHPAHVGVAQGVHLFGLDQPIAGAHELAKAPVAPGVVLGHEVGEPLALHGFRGLVVEVREDVVALGDAAVAGEVVHLLVFGRVHGQGLVQLEASDRVAAHGEVGAVETATLERRPPSSHPPRPPRGRPSLGRVKCTAAHL